jgi:hypothetical protein
MLANGVQAAPLQLTPQNTVIMNKVLSFNIARNVFTSNSYESDVTLGWYPIFYTATVPESRGLIFFGVK